MIGTGTARFVPCERDEMTDLYVLAPPYFWPSS